MRLRSFAVMCSMLFFGAVAAPTSANAATGPRFLTWGKGVGCSLPKLTTDSQGMSRGFALCGQTGQTGFTAFVYGTGASFTVAKVRGVGGTPVAVTDDGTATYAIFAIADTPTYAGAMNLVKRTRAGVVTTVRLGAGSTTDAAVAAHNGRWWATWALANGNCACTRIFTAKTMGRTWTTRRLPFQGNGVALAYRSPTSVVFAYIAPLRKLVVTTGTDSGFSTRFAWGDSVAPGGYTSVSVLFSGGVTRLGFTYWHTVASAGYADDASGRFVRHLSSHLSSGWDQQLAESNGHVFVTYFPSLGTWQRIAGPLTVMQRVQGRWSEIVVNPPSGYTQVATPAPIPIAAAGKVTVFIYVSGRGSGYSAYAV